MLYVASHLSLGPGSASATPRAKPDSTQTRSAYEGSPGPDAHKGFSGGGFGSGCRV